MASCKQKQAPNHCNTKANKNDSVEPVNKMNIMWCQAVTDFSGQHYFSCISSQHKHQADGKYDQALLNSISHKGGGSSDPEKKNGGVQCIHKKSGKKNFDIIAFAEYGNNLLTKVVYFYFFKEQKINTHYDQEYTSADTNLRTMSTKAAEQLCKNITDQYEGNIAC